MPRSLHGRVEVTEETLNDAREKVAERIADLDPAFALVKRVEFERRFDFLFLDLQDNPNNLLPEAKKTRDALVELGKAMADEGTDAPAGDSTFSAVYTYFGQFVDHDITLEKSGQPGMAPPVEEDLKPLPLEDIRNQTRNVRTGVLELDSVYNHPARRDPEPNGLKMKIGKVQPVPPNTRPPGKDDCNDLPRRPVPPNFPDERDPVKRDREALIGDPRNDENLIIAQLHLAFLRAHNRLLEETSPPERFEKAKRRLRRHYQYIVLHDFLKQIAEPSIVDDTIKRNRVYKLPEDEFFMPLEFAVAAYRFGHSMVRAEYDYNLNFNTTNEPPTPQNRATLDRLFTFTALSGQMGGEVDIPELETLPQNWIIQWQNFFRGATSSTKPARSTRSSSSHSNACRPWKAKTNQASSRCSRSGTSFGVTSCACPRARRWPARSTRSSKTCETFPCSPQRRSARARVGEKRETNSARCLRTRASMSARRFGTTSSQKLPYCAMADVSDRSAPRSSLRS